MLLPLHALPHPPQLSTLVFVLVSQPFVSLLLSQSAQPVVQAPEQTPLVQVGFEIWLLLHVCPHPPQ
jgi:hypothetical protein